MSVAVDRKPGRYQLKTIAHCGSCGEGVLEGDGGFCACGAITHRRCACAEPACVERARRERLRAAVGSTDSLGAKVARRIFGMLIAVVLLGVFQGDLSGVAVIGPILVVALGGGYLIRRRLGIA